MSKLYIFGVFFLLVSAAGSQPPDNPRSIRPSPLPGPASSARKALLIGNRSYRNAPLRTPINDAEDLAKSLQKLGFDTRIVADGTKAAIQGAVEKFSAGLEAGDVAVFFYSGHGMQIDAENYLVPVEFSAGNESQAKERSIPFSMAKSRLEQSPAALVLMILDSCRDNPFGPTKITVSGLALLEAGLGSYIAFAASPGRTASDNSSERNGLFTKHLLRELSKPIPVSELFRKVRQDVFEASAGKQLPYLHDQVILDVSLQSGRTGAQTAPAGLNTEPIVPGSLDLLDKGKSLLHQGNCEEARKIFDSLIRKQPDHAFAQNALGLAFRCLQMNVPAVERFSMAINLKPDYAASYLNRGEVFLSTAQYDLAIQDFTWGIEQDPENAIMYRRRGRARLGLRLYEDAQKDFSLAIGLDPSDSRAYLGRGLVKYQFGKFREAQEDYDNAILLKRDLAEAYRERARTRDRLGDRLGATEDRSAAIQYAGRN